MAPEQNIYSEEEAFPFADYLDSKSGEVIGTAEMRMYSTAKGVFSDTESVYRVLEELEKGSYVQKVEDSPEDRWRISSYAKEEDILNYLTDEEAYDRRDHPLGPEFDEGEITGSINMKELFSDLSLPSSDP